MQENQILQTKHLKSITLNVEIQKIKRIYDYAMSEDSFDVEKQRSKFAKFVTELDIRRGTNFHKTFPELKSMYVKYK